jgi:hypothetical protein
MYRHHTADFMHHKPLIIAEVNVGAPTRPQQLNQTKELNCGLIDSARDEQAVVALVICDRGARA